jgi:hypothetical protein
MWETDEKQMGKTFGRSFGLGICIPKNEKPFQNERGDFQNGKVCGLFSNIVFFHFSV